MSERAEAERDGATLQPNSGRGKHRKGDAIFRNFLIDYKEANKSVQLTREMWSKICTDTIKVDIGLSPVLKLIIGEKLPVRVAVMEWEAFIDLVERAERCERLHTR